MHLSLPPVAWAAVRSKAVVLLLFIYCLMYFPLFVGVLCLPLHCFVMHYFVSFLVSQSSLKRRRELVALLLLSCGCLGCGSPRGAVGWSAVCDCGIS